MNEPVDRIKDEALDQPVDRRGFIKYILLGFSALATAGGVLYPIISFLWPPRAGASGAGDRVAAASAADLPVGQGAVYSVSNKPVIVIHTPDGFKALDAVCTHLGCIVFWNEQRQVIACPCHEAYFNTNGAVISGPPPSPLEIYRVQVEGDQIYVEGGAA
jgi:cytochrome b6-f complex iron-sulfur subunit